VAQNLGFSIPNKFSLLLEFLSEDKKNGASYEEQFRVT
jgi:hypothetical protein